MQNSADQIFLRRVLLADAATSGAMGVLLLADARIMERLLGLPAALLEGAGAILLPFAALVALLATRTRLPRLAVWTVIAVNIAWTAESILLLLGGWVHPTLLGQAFVLAQALAVACFAAAERWGLQRRVAAAA